MGVPSRTHLFDCGLGRLPNRGLHRPGGERRAVIARADQLVERLVELFVIVGVLDLELFHLFEQRLRRGRRRIARGQSAGDFPPVMSKQDFSFRTALQRQRCTASGRNTHIYKVPRLQVRFRHQQVLQGVCGIIRQSSEGCG